MHITTTKSKHLFEYDLSNQNEQISMKPLEKRKNPNDPAKFVNKTAVTQDGEIF